MKKINYKSCLLVCVLLAAINTSHGETYLESHQAGFGLTLPWEIDTVSYVDRHVTTESGHILGMTLTLADGSHLSMTRRDNRPKAGVSMEEWNRTWYDEPVEGMSDERYLAIWKEKSPSLAESYDMEGGLLRDSAYEGARWDRLTRRNTSPLRTTFDIDAIPTVDPFHRYVLTMDYEGKDRYHLDTLLGLFHQLTVGGKKVHRKSKKNALEMGWTQYTLPSLTYGNTGGILPPDVKRLGQLYRERLLRGRSMTIKGAHLVILDDGIGYYEEGTLYESGVSLHGKETTLRRKGNQNQPEDFFSLLEEKENGATSEATFEVKENEGPIELHNIRLATYVDRAGKIWFRQEVWPQEEEKESISWPSTD